LHLTEWIFRNWELKESLKYFHLENVVAAGFRFSLITRQAQNDTAFLMFEKPLHNISTSCIYPIFKNKLS